MAVFRSQVLFRTEDVELVARISPDLPARRHRLCHAQLDPATGEGSAEKANAARDLHECAVVVKGGNLGRGWVRDGLIPN